MRNPDIPARLEAPRFARKILTDPRAAQPLQRGKIGATPLVEPINHFNRVFAQPKKRYLLRVQTGFYHHFIVAGSFKKETS
jgi:hypothetical protein